MRPDAYERIINTPIFLFPFAICVSLLVIDTVIENRWTRTDHFQSLFLFRFQEGTHIYTIARW